MIALRDPSPLAKEEMLRLAELVRLNLSSHVESGTLISAFNNVIAYPGGNGTAAVGLGDPAILSTPKPVAGRGYIADFVKWLRGERSRRWEAFRQRAEASRAERTRLTKLVRLERSKIRAAERSRVAARIKRQVKTKAAREERRTRTGLARNIAKLGEQIKRLSQELKTMSPQRFASQKYYAEWQERTFSELQHFRSIRSQTTWELKRLGRKK
jgi:hypothetical protein